MPEFAQTIRYVTTRDQVRLAWATSGSGPTLVKTSNWITHLEYDWESPVWRHWVRDLSNHFTFIRYDERGCGLSRRNVDETSQDVWLPDLEDVLAAAKPAKPFILLGISQGSCAAVAYAVKHPEHVSHLVLYGGYARGWAKRDNPDHVREGKALVEFTELGWGRSDPLYRRLFTKRFLPQGTEEQLSWFDALCLKTTTPKMAARLLVSRGNADVRPLLSQVRVPCLVIHANEDRVVPFADGQELAANIPGARFVQVDSVNHILLEHEHGWQKFKDVLLEFTGVGAAAESAVFETLAAREREILGKLLEGLTNVEIGKQLFISEKTVRNQLTRVFDKLGVSNRSQAIVLARNHGFREPDAQRK